MVIETVSDRLLACWGKTGEGITYHPALYHMLDVGHVAQVLLAPPASLRWRSSLANALDADADTLAGWLPYFVALHDMGKLTPDFQAQVGSQVSRLKAAGLSLDAPGNLHHPLYSQVFFKQEHAEATGIVLPERLQGVFAEAAGGHHGEFAASRDVKGAHNQMRYYEAAAWRSLRAEAAQHLAAALLTQPATWPDLQDVSAAVMLFTGFTVLCDWLGSDSNRFPCSTADWTTYLPLSADSGQQAARGAGFLATFSSAAPTEFARLFPDKLPPRPLQPAVDEIPDAVLAEPCLAIIEAPTGEGKTEAALALAHRIARLRGTDELYYALPTTATSNQMFLRLQEHLSNRLDLTTDCKLVHGQAFLVQDDLRLNLPLVKRGTGPHEGLEWFAPRKRALLAPFGVGTVDQLELAVLNVRHTSLRMIGLAQKVVIIDEVHAYDIYMTTIIELLLAWLSSIGSSVILLSATLPQSRRSRLAAAFGAPELAVRAAAYPALSVDSGGGHYRASPSAYNPERRIELGWIGFDHADAVSKARWLAEQVANGGCACWMANTVRKAQDIFRALLAINPPGVDLTLLHAQFPLDERQTRETALRNLYGPTGQRPERGIVVGTQVLEQSLDLDFDVMATDLAPVDLVLQRAGRLHRHDRPRPAAHDHPRLWINVVEGPDRPDLGVDVWVYQPFLLLQTWKTLAGKHELRLPADYRPLVDTVYDAAGPTYAGPFRDAWQKLRDAEEDARQKAATRLLPAPDPDWSIAASASRLVFEESETNAAYIVAQTRLGDDNIGVIPLTLREPGYAALAGKSEPSVRLAAPPSRAEELTLLHGQLRIHDRDAVRYLRATMAARPRLFTDSVMLKDYAPLWLEGGEMRWLVDGRAISLKLDPQLGLVITKEGGKTCQKQ